MLEMMQHYVERPRRWQIWAKYEVANGLISRPSFPQIEESINASINSNKAWALDYQIVHCIRWPINDSNAGSFDVAPLLPWLLSKLLLQRNADVIAKQKTRSTEPVVQ